MADDITVITSLSDQEGFSPDKTRPKKLEQNLSPKTHRPLKPHLSNKFKQEHIRTIITATLESTLGGQIYNSETAKEWTTDIANTLNEELARLGMERYKHVVQVTIAELRGAGIKSGFRCIWDLQADGFISQNFFNDTLVAGVLIFFVYLY